MADRLETWKTQASALHDSVMDAAREVNKIRITSPAAIGTQPYIDAQLAHLNAVKSYNDFLSTDKTIWKVVDQIQNKLNTDTTLTTFQHDQLVQIRTGLNQQAGEFQSFVTSAGLKPEFAPSVQSDGRVIHYDGRSEWNTGTAQGVFGASLDAIRDAMPDVMQALILPKSNSAQACTEAVNGLLGMGLGKLGALTMPGS